MGVFVVLANVVVSGVCCLPSDLILSGAGQCPFCETHVHLVVIVSEEPMIIVNTGLVLSHVSEVTRSIELAHSNICSNGGEVGEREGERKWEESERMSDVIRCLG